ncbi:MAG: hypothetical protein SCJ97_06450 [Bacillota bacterium]|nr:hypothetical protein [Bacillota bacterium]
MPQVELNMVAPDFSLEDFKGNNIRLSDYKDKNHILLVLNRGFV